MLTARAHNALARRILCWTRFSARLDPRLGDLLQADPAAVDVLAGLSGDAVIETPDRSVAADLLVLLDHLNLHAGTRLSVAPLGSWRYRVHGTGIDGNGPAIERIAVITRDRSATLAAVLDAYADNLRRFDREYVEIVVYDDSGVDERHRVRELAEERGIRYVGPDEKHALRTAIEGRLPGPAPERADVLDALLGRREADGTWTGSAAAQRNWAILSAAGSRVLVCDDDVRPAVLDAPLGALRAAANEAVAAGRAGAPGDLLEQHLRSTDVEAWPTDLIGQLENTDARLVSAAYTGHPDRRTALWLERFFEPSDESVDVLGTGIPPQRVRRGTPAATGRKFRGAAFASSGSLDGLEFAVRRGRNEDFSLGLSAHLTSRGRLEPTEAAGAYILHLRGPRATSTFTAHREEREGNAVNAIVRRIGSAHAVTDPGPFDAVAFRAFGLATLDAALDREFAAADVGSELFDEGLAYRERAREPDARWLDDPATARADLLREGVDRLRNGGVPADAVLMECAQVLVPQGFLTTLHPSAMRRAWARLSDVERAEAARCLADEARYLTSVRGPQHSGPQPPGPSPEWSARKAERARRLADDIERELRLRHHGSEPEAREAFRAEVRSRVRAEIRLYLTAIPYVATVRAELTRVAR